MKQYAEFLHAIADDKQVQWQDSQGRWVSQDVLETFREFVAQEHDPARYRVAPAVIVINGREVPEPMRAAPDEGAEYFFTDLETPDCHFTCRWGNDATDLRRLERGICHSTKEAAAAHGAALLSFTKC